MKKIFKLLFVFLFVMLPFNVSALSLTFDIDCGKSVVVPGSVVSCKVKGNVIEGGVSSLSAHISVGGFLAIESVEVDSKIWQGNGEGNVLDLYTDENKTGAFDIATIKVKTSDNVSGSSGTLSLSDIKCFDENFQPVLVTGLSTSIRTMSTVNTLASLSLSSGTLSPSFSADTLSYSATVDASSVDIGATLTDSKSKLSGDVGTVQLKYGVNTFKINVTSEASTVKTYIINITRPDNRDTDNTLSNLTVDNKGITLKSGVFEYSYEVESSVNSVDIGAVLNSVKSSFIDGYGPRKIDLKEGENKVEIKVLAENESTKTYTIVINRKKANVNKEEANTGNNSSSSGTSNQGNKTESNVTDNPKTGSFIWSVVVVLVISLLVGSFSYWYYKKKRRKEDNEKK